MARETKAERMARWADERANQQEVVWAEFTLAYPARFASLLFNFMNLNYADFRVKKLDDETYEFANPNYLYQEVTLKVTPPANYTYDTLDAMDALEASLAEYAREQAEAQRKVQVRAAALAKLSKEERELLNL